MIVFRDIAAFRAFLQTQLPARIEAGMTDGLQKAGETIAKEMRAEIGTYQGGDAGFDDWSPLAARTVRDKQATGAAWPGRDNPLLRTGEMRESIGVKVDGKEAVIGTNDMVAVYQEMGTESNPQGAPIPARSFIARGAFRKAGEAVEQIGAAIIGAMTK